MKKALLSIPLALVIWFLIYARVNAATVNVSNLENNTQYNEGDIIHNDTDNNFSCAKSAYGGGAISSMNIAPGEDYTLECNFIYGNFDLHGNNHYGFYSFLCIPKGIQTITVNEGDTVTISKDDGYTVYDSGACQLEYTWTELNESNEYIPYRGYSGESITISDVQCSRNHHKFKMEIVGWSQMYDDSHRPPEMYFELIVNHVEEHHHYPAETVDESQADTVESDVEELVPDIIDEETVSDIENENVDIPDVIYDISLAITPGLFDVAFNKIADKTPEGGKICLYSSWPIGFSSSILREIDRRDIPVVYYFWHKGHLYSVTILSGADLSALSKNIFFYEGPLYVGKILGTSVLIK